MQDPAAELAGVHGDVLGALWLPDDPSCISDHLCVCSSAEASGSSISSMTPHGRSDVLPERAASTASLHIEYAITAVAQLSIPPLSGRKYP